MAGAVAGLAGGTVWAGGVLGGGVLSGASYWAIRSSVDALVLAALPPSTPAQPHSPRPVWRAVLVLLGRHALLALAAYVIIARLRLQPIGLLIGASAVAVAAVAESLRGLRR